MKTYSKKINKLYIVDPELTAITQGHHYTQAAAISAECAKIGLQVEIFCKVGVTPSIDGALTFGIFKNSIGVESNVEHLLFEVFENYFVVNRAFFKELCNIDISNFSKKDLIYFPNILQNQLEAIADWLSIIAPTIRPRVAITLRYANSKMDKNIVREFGSAIEFLYRNSMPRLIERCPQINFYTDTPELAAFYSAVSSIKVGVLPLPRLEFKFTKKVKKNTEKISILFAGHLFGTRGAALLPQILCSILEKYENVYFRIQVNEINRKTSQQLIENIPAQLKRKVNFLLGVLSPEKYDETLQQSDILILPLLPRLYAYHSSGVFAEAAALGKVMVIPGGTSLESAANLYGLGVVVSSEFTSESFSLALGKAIDEFDMLSIRAENSKHTYNQENSPAMFLKKLLNII
jgi:glycosyltransferase involved in cell wall biosynthesis